MGRPFCIVSKSQISSYKLSALLQVSIDYIESQSLNLAFLMLAFWKSVVFNDQWIRVLLPVSNNYRKSQIWSQNFEVKIMLTSSSTEWGYLSFYRQFWSFSTSSRVVQIFLVCTFIKRYMHVPTCTWLENIDCRGDHSGTVSQYVSVIVCYYHNAIMKQYHNATV